MKINSSHNPPPHNDGYATLPLAPDVTSVSLGNRETRSEDRGVCRRKPFTDKMVGTEYVANLTVFCLGNVFLNVYSIMSLSDKLIYVDINVRKLKLHPLY